MNNYKNKFIHYLNKKGIEYIETTDFNVKMTYKGKNLDTIPIYILFDEDGKGYITLYCWNMAQYRESKLNDGYVVCNDLNNNFYWAKFFLDTEHEMIAQTSTVVDYDTVVETCLTLLRSFANDVDNAYPFVLKGLLN